MKKLILIIASVLLLFSCNEQVANRKEEFNNLKQQAMDSHDVIMPKMDELMQLSSRLTAIKDSTNVDTVMKTKGQLEKANEDMMVWMRDYSDKFPYGYELPDDEKEATEKLQLMQEEFEEIEELKVRTLKTIEEAKQMLQQ